MKSVFFITKFCYEPYHRDELSDNDLPAYKVSDDVGVADNDLKGVVILADVRAVKVFPESALDPSTVHEKLGDVFTFREIARRGETERERDGERRGRGVLA